MCLLPLLLPLVSTLAHLGGAVHLSRSLTPTPAAHFRSFFYVDGNPTAIPPDPNTGSTAGHILADPMYVEHLTPTSGVSQRHPLVFIHGKSMTGTNFLQTASGEPGWASFFLNKGYELFIVDQVNRARSAWNPLGPPSDAMTVWTTEITEQRFTAVQDFNLWPQAVNHTQWPGSGRLGDPIFDAFSSATVQFLANDTVAQIKMRTAGAKLLDMIGRPAFVITHSQGGLHGWPMADARPQLVKAIIALEPSGPPFHEVIFTNVSARAFGVTDIPMAFAPPIKSAAELQTQQFPPVGPNLVPCILQKEPGARRFANVRDTPMMVLTSQASYHSAYDHCTAEFLKQAGVKEVDFVRMEDIGIFGNGHMFFLEKNSWDIAAFVEGWIHEHS